MARFDLSDCFTNVGKYEQLLLDINKYQYTVEEDKQLFIKMLLERWMNGDIVRSQCPVFPTLLTNNIIPHY